MYRPTVRMDESYRQFVENVFHASILDRNQIVRLALFSAPFSGLFRSKVEQNLSGGARECPGALWTPKQSELWKGQGE